MLAQREVSPRLPAQPVPPGRLAAFVSLWRQRWEPPLPDERPPRLTAAGASALLHLLLAVVFVWLVATRFLAAPEPAAGDAALVQVEYIGTGTPEVVELPSAPVPPADARPTAPAAPRPGPADVPVTVARPTPSDPSPPVPEPIPQPVPAPAPVVADQPLQVTEVAQADTTFVLPPTRPAEARTRALPQAEVPLRQRAITVLDVPPMPAASTALQVPRPPSVVAEAPEVVVRDIPLQTPALRPLREVSPIPLPALDPRAAEVVERTIPTPAATTTPAPVPVTPAAGAATATRPEPARASSPSAAPATVPGTRAATFPSTAGQGARPSSESSAGTPGSPRRGDDWGVGPRDRVGGQQGAPGLYNADGTPRLADGGRVGGGLPPGTITEDYEQIDRMGTWLKRPPAGYQPTAFDRFWVPHETLLAEWVRRSIKEVLIPIPGTSKRIKCSVAILALGGACGMTDANLQDIEAGARPPPDVPFRPELQEDQDSLRRPR